MSLFTFVPLALLAGSVLIAAISAWTLIESVNDWDAGSAWMWGAVFLLSSLVAALWFWRLM